MIGSSALCKENFHKVQMPEETSVSAYNKGNYQVVDCDLKQWEGKYEENTIMYILFVCLVFNIM
ncbi:MAG: hypothetical protein CM15mV8_1930 [Caudoviricetes sp.]|nr:MAG: hypothetical protein CM15mV8_1930 [Caudoviricetes sp.]